MGMVGVCSDTTGKVDSRKPESCNEKESLPLARCRDGNRLFAGQGFCGFNPLEDRGCRVL
jgi:hypothetical protein